MGRPWYPEPHGTVGWGETASADLRVGTNR